MEHQVPINHGVTEREPHTGKAAFNSATRRRQGVLLRPSPSTFNQKLIISYNCGKYQQGEPICFGGVFQIPLNNNHNNN